MPDSSQVQSGMVDYGMQRGPVTTRSGGATVGTHKGIKIHISSRWLGNDSLG